MPLNWRTLPPLAALRAFDATARHGDFASAARALNVTHAAVAQQVRALEAHLGVGLAVRQGRRVVLTDAGERLAKRLGDGFDAIAQGVMEIKDSATTRGLRVTVSPFMAERIIMPRLAEFWAAHPGAEISLSPTRTFVDVVREGFDLAIRTHLEGHDFGHPPNNVDSAHIAPANMICILSPDLLARRGPDLDGLPWLWHDGFETKMALMRMCGIDVDRLERVPIGSANLLLEAVRQGLGATIFNAAIARDEIAAGGIAEVPLPKTGGITYRALTPKGHKHPLAAPFTAWVKTLL